MLSKVITDLESAVRAFQTCYETNWLLQDLEHQIQHLRDILAILKDIHSRNLPERYIGIAANSLDESSIFTTRTQPCEHYKPFISFNLRLDDGMSAGLIDEYRVKLARALGNRYLHTGRINDIDEQEQLYRAVLASSNERSIRIPAMSGLGTALRARFEKFGAVGDINASVDHHRMATEDADLACAEYPWYEAELGRSLTRRFQYTGNRGDLEEALVLQRHAIQMVSQEYRYRDQLLSCIGNVLHVSYRASGDLSTLRDAIFYHEKSLELRPLTHRDRHLSLNGLALTYKILYECTAQPEYLDNTIRLLQEALVLRMEGLPERDKYLNNLATSIETRYTISGSERDLEDAIEYGQQALTLRPPGHPLRSSALTNLSIPLSHRAVRSGDISDLDQSIMLKREVLELCGPGHHRRAVILINLGDSLRTRFEVLGQDNDLDEALVLFRESLGLCPQGRHEHGLALFNLVQTLQKRYDATASLRDLEEAIGLHQSWFQDASKTDSSSRQSYFAFVAGGTYKRHFHHFGDASSLRRAIDLYSTCVRLCEDGQPQLPLALHKLASALRIRYRLFKEQEDVRSAFEHQTKAMKLLPPGHPDRAQVLCGAAHLHLMDGTAYFEPHRALDYLADALVDPQRSARLRLEDALDVLDTLEHVSKTHELRLRVLHIYRLAVSLLPQIAYFGLDVRSRLHVLKRGDKLGTTTAFQALALSKTEEALETLEEGRAVFWAQYLRLRTSFDALPAGLRDELTTAARQLELGPTSGSGFGDQGYSKSRAEEEGLRHRRLGERLEVLMKDARSLPGFDRLMLHDTFATLAVAATCGPVVVLLADSTASYAIVIPTSSGRAEQVPLPGLTAERLLQLKGLLQIANKLTRGISEDRGMRSVLSRTCRARSVLGELWAKAIQPILAILHSKPAVGRQRQRLWICPTGPFVHLPIHAAGEYTKGATDYLSSHFVSSYTPTLGALINARGSPAALSRRELKVLLAAVSRAENWTPLLYTHSEIASIHEVIPSHAIIHMPAPSSLLDASACATAADVLEKVPDATILHLACHGYQSLVNPLDSGFVMQDGMLTVSRLMALHLPRAFLAFLSACETARGDARQPDQAIHLASTMLFAGFKSVVGTMWSMGDVDGPIVAKRVYEELFRGDSEYLDPDAIPYALDAAMHELRGQGLHVSRWAPYVHIGV